MKMIKNDSRYILKRIIIGVGIALILSFLKTNNVFADEVNICLSDSSLSCNENQDKINFSFKSPYSNNNYNFKGTASNIPYITMYDNISNSYYTAYFYGNSSYYNVDLFNIKMITNYSGSTRTVWYGYKCNDLEDSSCQNGYKFIGGFQYSFVLSNNNNLDYSTWNDFSFSMSVNILNSPIPNEYFYVANTNNILSNDFVYDNFSNFSVYSSNLDSFSIEDNEIYDGSPIIPSGYSEINLTGSEGVYFVPKNYNQVPIEHIDSTDYIDFDYYYQGNIKEGWFPLNNVDKMFFSDLVFSSSSLELRDSFFPMYEDPNNTASGYNYYAYMIFNNSQENSTIYYNSQFFNAYKIEDFSTYKENICYYNRNNNETCLDIDFASSYNNSWLQGFGEDNSNFVGGQEQNQSKFDKLFSIIKVPFNFLNSLKNYQCSSITLPIPFTNNSMTLQCLSGKFREVMGENLFNIIYTILTAFYAYRITIMNIDTATDILNPSDDKLEVVDL